MTVTMSRMATSSQLWKRLGGDRNAFYKRVPNREDQFNALLWLQLLDEGIVDSWQCRSVMLGGLLDEIEKTCIASASRPSLKAQLPYLQAELKSLIHRFPWDYAVSADGRAVALRLAETDWNKRDPRSVVRIIRELMGNEEDAGALLIREAMSQKKPQHSKIEEAMHLIVSAMGRQGRHVSALRHVAVQAIAEEPASVTHAMLNHIQHNMNNCAEYKCWLSLGAGNDTSHTVRNMGFPLVPYSELVAAHPEMTKYFPSLKSDSKFTQVTTQSSDSFTAAEYAYDTVSSAASAARLYRPNRRIRFADSPICVESAGAFDVVPAPSAYSSTMPELSVSEPKFRKAIHVLQGVAEDDRERLSVALEYHARSLSQGSDPARLVMLWTALEALCSRDTASIIDSVCEAIPQMYAMAKSRRLFEAVWKEVASFGMHTGLISVPSESMSRIGVAAALMDERGGAQIEALYKVIGQDPLLCYRVHGIRKHHLHSPSVFSASHRRTCTHVDWQLRRLFRVRSNIVHRGKWQSSHRLLVYHLHSYLSTAIFDVMDVLSVHPTWRIQDVFDYRATTYGELQQALQGKGADLLSSRTVFDPRRVRYGETPIGIWRSGPTPAAATDGLETQITESS